MKRKRFLLYGANALVLSLIVLGILIVLNYLAYKRDSRLDVTEEKLHSLSDQTIKVVNNLDKEIEVLAFFKEVGVDRREFQDLINGYTKKSDKIKAKFIDPDKEPGLSKKYEVNDYGTVVLVKGDQNVKVKLADLISGSILDNSEEEITNGIIKLTKDKKKTVYFLAGHGEGDIKDDSEPSGFGNLKRALEGESYNVKELVVLSESNIQIEDSILVVAGSKKPLIEKEIKAVKKYLDEGGKAVFMIEPRSGDNLVSFLRNYGFDIRNDIIIDPSSKLVGGGDIAPIIAEYPTHDITNDFKFATIFPYSRSMNVNKRGKVKTTLIANTSQYSWAESDFSLFDKGTAQQDPGDKPGPLGIVAVGEIGDKAKIAVFGSVDFASNRFFDFSGNSDFFLNTINWVSGDEDLISIRPSLAKEGKLTLSGNQMRIIFSITVIVLPAIVLFSGIAVWWKRRNM
ncbi:MAG: GldG family protein [Candidatus Dadabacteria bacterium]|nr:GldG family protein [Candidatus Dadabacteria bacterium]